MCGILGVISFSANPIAKPEVQKALSYINHRGPDHNSIYEFDHGIFGHTRLSIIDLDSRSNQPFISEDKNYILVFNGEIYNFKNLRKDLERKGISFSTTSDTEVLLMGYIEEGQDFIRKCEGIFSLAIWDRKKEELFLCRDRFGIKPLYYFFSNDKVIFSSEIKPILHLLKDYQIDYQVLKNFARFRYHPGEETPFVGVLHFPIGSWAKISKEKTLTHEQYWSVDSFKNIIKINEIEAIEQFRYKFKKSIESQLIADVPVGVFLSGGVDSSSVFSLANNAKSGLHAFTLGLRTSDDEIHLAKEICESRQGIFHSINIENEDFNIYKKTLWHLEEPLADSILSATYHLAAFARKNVKVVLSGEGADEILGGYIHHKFLSNEDKIHKLKLKRLFKFFIKFAPLQLMESLFPYRANLGQKGLKKLRDQVQYVGQWGLAYEKIVELFEADFFSSDNDSSIWQELWDKNPSSDDFLNNLTRFDLKYWNAKYTLLRLDKLTMAHGLEARVPFLDSELCSFTLSLPQSMKIKNAQNKWVLRRAMYENNYLNRKEAFRKKQAFFLPIEKTYGKKFLEFAADTLLSKKSLNRGIYSLNNLKKVIDDDYRGLLVSKQLMALLITELWCELYVDGDWKIL
jgi:asparagine synthase (glutamine-hydrolysing)